MFWDDGTAVNPQHWYKNEPSLGIFETTVRVKYESDAKLFLLADRGPRFKYNYICQKQTEGRDNGLGIT